MQIPLALLSGGETLSEDERKQVLDFRLFAPGRIHAVEVFRGTARRLALADLVSSAS